MDLATVEKLFWIDGEVGEDCAAWLIKECNRLTQLCDEQGRVIDKIRATVRNMESPSLTLFNKGREAAMSEYPIQLSAVQDALKAEREARSKDNADLTDQILAAESALSQAMEEVERLKRGAAHDEAARDMWYAEADKRRITESGRRESKCEHLNHAVMQMNMGMCAAKLTTGLVKKKSFYVLTALSLT